MGSTFFPQEFKIAPALVWDGLKRVPVKKLALLINPFYPKDPHASFGKHVLTPSLALTSVAGATPDDWNVEYWDENLLQGPPPTDRVPEVVGITVHLTFSERAYALAKFYRMLGSKVVLGGLHVLSCPEEAAQHADAIALSEGSQVWAHILRDAEAGALKPVYSGSYLLPYSQDPAPRRDLLRKGSFLTTTSVIATRGCHNRCGFCYLSTKGLQMPYQVRGVQQVVEEIRADGQPYAVFVDNNLGSKPEYLKKLCEGLKDLEMIWSAAVTLDITDHPEVVREMALAGCTGVFIGFESLTDDNLTAARKKTPKSDDFARRVRMLHDHGIQVNGSFVLGFDHDGPEVFEKTVEWVEKNRLECATFHILTPYPGTPLFAEMEKENRLLHRDWEKYDTAHVVFRPRKMTENQLAEGYAWCYRTLFSPGSIWRRRPEDWRAVVPYLGMSWLYKKSNRFWHILIKHNLTAKVWHPLVEINRRRHLCYRKRLANAAIITRQEMVGSWVSAGV
ncbi:MAG: B12-binding domain-containing radical SAM protein [Verrucomicrobiales bacterium]